MSVIRWSPGIIRTVVPTSQSQDGGAGGGEDGSASFTKEQPHQSAVKMEQLYPSVVKTKVTYVYLIGSKVVLYPLLFQQILLLHVHLRATWFHNYTIEQHRVCLH